MNQPLLGVSLPRRPFVFKLSARIASVVAMALLLSGAWTMCAVAAPPTRTRSVRVRRSAALTVAASKARGRAVKPSGRRPEAKRPGTRQSDAKAKSLTPTRPGARSRRHSRAEDAAPLDLPTMYRARLGRNGRRRLSTIRERQALLRSAAIRRVAFEAAASASPLRGTHEVLVHQNLMATGEGLERIQDDANLDRLRASNDLVDFTPSRSLRINPELPDNRRCARPWTVLFAQDLAQEFYDKFGEPLMVTSAVRTVAYQRRLTRVNGNAAGIEGDSASPHLTGQALDIGKRGMSHAQLTWMRDRLLPMMQSGEIDVEEEFHQACFHISVYRTYLPVEIAPAVKLAQTVPIPADTSVPPPSDTSIDQP